MFCSAVCFWVQDCMLFSDLLQIFGKKLKRPLEKPLLRRNLNMYKQKSKNNLVLQRQSALQF